MAHGNNKSILDKEHNNRREIFRLQEQIQPLKNKQETNGWKWLTIITIIVLIIWLMVSRLSWKSRKSKVVRTLKSKKPNQKLNKLLHKKGLKTSSKNTTSQR